MHSISTAKSFDASLLHLSFRTFFAYFQLHDLPAPGCTQKGQFFVVENAKRLEGSVVLSHSAGFLILLLFDHTDSQPFLEGVGPDSQQIVLGSSDDPGFLFRGDSQQTVDLFASLLSSLKHVPVSFSNNHPNGSAFGAHEQVRFAPASEEQTGGGSVRNLADIPPDNGIGDNRPKRNPSLGAGNKSQNVARVDAEDMDEVFLLPVGDRVPILQIMQLVRVQRFVPLLLVHSFLPKSIRQKNVLLNC